MTKFIAAGKTQAGTNHPVNEDRLLLDGNVLCCGLVGDCERGMGCMAVFDGVSEGGHGAAASTLAAQAFAQAVHVFDTDAVNTIEGRLRVAGERAENDVETYAARYGLSVAASTVAGLAVAPDGHATVFNAGDSRVYRVRGGALAVLSCDHTPEWRMGGVDAGCRGDAVSHCIELAIGLNQGGRNLEVKITVMLPGDRYLICSDGIYGQIAQERLQQILASDATCAQLCEELYAEARMNGSTDDATLIVIEAGE